MEDLSQKLTVIKSDVTQLCQKIESLKVVDGPSQNLAADYLGQIKVRLKRIEELRIFFTGHLNDQVKKINNQFKLETGPLEKYERILKEGLREYMDAEEAKARAESEKLAMEQAERERIERAKVEAARKKEEELRKQAEEAKTKKQREEFEKKAEAAKKLQEAAQKKLDNIPIETVEAPEKSVRSESGLVVKKTVTKWEVEDLGVLRRSHPELFILDEKAVSKLVSSGERQIAGIRIYQDSSISVNT